MSEIAIKVENISKRYRIGVKEEMHDTFYGAVSSFIKSPFKQLNKLRKLSIFDPKEDGEDIIWALKDVSFEIKKGDVVGIIGRNGAGKSTLLKILSRITEPTGGIAKIYGRVASLLEVGTGFHPELTGRENIYLNGAILGMKKGEINRKFDEIVAFAEVEKFLDTPVKRYSSGMYVRLAFAVAAHLEPEILMVDEVLAVGDAAFQKKCLGKMGDAAKEGRTVLFVSHNIGAINKLCPYSLLIDSGYVQAFDRSFDIIEKYLASVYKTSGFKTFPLRPDCKGQILSVRLLDEYGVEASEFACGNKITVEVNFALHNKVRGLHVACIVSTNDGYHLLSTTDTDTAPYLLEERLPGKYQVRFRLPTDLLNIGIYHLSFVMEIPGIESFDRQEAVSFTIYDGGDFGTLKERGRRAGVLLVEIPWEYV